MVVTKRMATVLAAAALSASLASCTVEMETQDLNFESGIRLTVIHTGDIHSRLLPYDMDLMATDERIGMTQANEPFGGIARAATVIKQIRNAAQHSVHVDSGDVFQGAPIFNEFEGEPEILAVNHIGMDAFIIGNHEFDFGASNLYDKLAKAQFSVLAANYLWRNTQGTQTEPLKEIARPYAIINANGVKVAVIGMANYSSMSSITYGDNTYGITVLENIELVQSYVDLLKNEANILTMVTHLGLGDDEDVIRKTTGLDIVFGGHLHVVLNPPKNIPDASVDEMGNETPKMVPLVHSGAFMKYVGYFDGVLYPDYMIRPERYPKCQNGQGDCNAHDLTLVSHTYKPIPIESTLADDPDMEFVIAPYEMELARRLDLRKIIGYAPQKLNRFGSNGHDSPLGNFLADQMVFRQRSETDFGATNSLGIRTDVNQGPVTNDQLYNVFPFPNTLTTMTLSGTEVWSLLDYNTYRSMNRGCQSQLQLSGARYTLDCHTAKSVVDDYLDAGYLFDYQYRVDAFKKLCGDKIVPATADTPDYCIRVDADGNKWSDYSSVHFAKDITFVRGSCEREDANGRAYGDESLCHYTDAELGEGKGITKCEKLTDSESGDHYVCIEMMQPQWFYKFSTNNYMAHGGSGFSTLKYNTTQADTGIELRAVSIDGIEKMQSCYDRCTEDFCTQLDAKGNCIASSFPEDDPQRAGYKLYGKCKRLRDCKQDTIEYEKKWCKSLYKYSEQEVCFDKYADTSDGTAGSAQCIGLKKQTDFDLCLIQNYPDCGKAYKSDDIKNCYLAYEAKLGYCQKQGKTAENASSDYSKCADNFLPSMPQCAGLSAVSEYDQCVADAEVKAETICMDIACFIASTDGRQNSVRPHTRFDDEAAASAPVDYSSFGNGAAIMEALQDAGEDACY